jgi:hypothetical protein
MFGNYLNNIRLTRRLRQQLIRLFITTSRKVAGSRSNEVNTFFSIYLILPAALGPQVYSASNTNEYQKQEK